MAAKVLGELTPSYVCAGERVRAQEYTSRMNTYTKQGDREAAQLMQVKLQEVRPRPCVFRTPRLKPSLNPCVNAPCPP